MLVLTRHCGEQLVIAGDIVVTVVAIEGNKIRLGVDAPKSIRVDRQEVHSRRMAEEAAASVNRGEAVAAGV
jgi:carbon storage regulator